MLTQHDSALAQRHAALTIANQRRKVLAKVRDDLHKGTLSVRKVIAHPPDVLLDDMVFDVLLRARGFGYERLKLLNRRAVRDGVNLAISLGDMSDGTREWLIGNLPAIYRGSGPTTRKPAGNQAERARKGKRATVRRPMKPLNMVDPAPLRDHYARLLARGRTSTELAKAAGFTRSTELARTLNYQQIRVSTAERLCKAFDLDPHEAGV